MHVLLRSLVIATLFITYQPAFSRKSSSSTVPTFSAKITPPPNLTPNLTSTLTPTTPPIDQPEITRETITAKVGEIFTVKLPANYTTGVSWYIALSSLDNQITQYLKQEYIRNPNPGEAMGVGGQLILHFKAINAGSTAIRLSHQDFSGKVYTIHIVDVTVQ